MNMIKPIRLTDAMLQSSTVPENDHDAWSVGTTYALGARVIVVATHAVYESATEGNVGNDPTAVANTAWIKIGATNRWRAFDQKTGQTTSRANTIVFTITLPSVCTGVAFIGLDARSVTVQARDGQTVVYNNTQQLVDPTPINNFFSYFTYKPEFKNVAVFENVAAYTGYTLVLTVEATGGNAEVGEITFGRVENLGVTTVGTEISFEDLSIIDRDDFNNVEIIERGYFGEVNFTFTIPVGGEGRVRKLISDNRASPALFYASSTINGRGTTIFGLAKPIRIPLEGAGVSFATLEVEELS